MDINVQLYWGVKGIDKSKASMWDAIYIGSVQWDDTFSIYPKEAQLSLIQLCQDLKSTKADHIVLRNEATCWIDEFQEWYRAKIGALPQQQVMPLEPEVFQELLNEFATKDAKGKSLLTSNKIGFKDGKLIFH